jgi:hypothetical protein
MSERPSSPRRPSGSRLHRRSPRWKIRPIPCLSARQAFRNVRRSMPRFCVNLVLTSDVATWPVLPSQRTGRDLNQPIATESGIHPRGQASGYSALNLIEIIENAIAIEIADREHAFSSVGSERQRDRRPPCFVWSSDERHTPSCKCFHVRAIAGVRDCRPPEWLANRYSGAFWSMNT